MNVAVTGATGLIGRELVRALLARGDRVTVLSRDADRARRGARGRRRALLGRSQEPGRPRRGAGRAGRRDPPARRERRTALERLRQDRDPRLAGARDAQPRRGPARRRASAARAGLAVGQRLLRPSRRRARGRVRAGRRGLPRRRHRRLGGAGPQGGGARRAGGHHSHGRRVERRGRRARQDAPLLQGRGRRTRRRREAVHALDPQRRRGRIVAVLPRRRARLGAGQPERSRAGDQQGALEGAGPGPAAPRLRPGAGASRSRPSTARWRRS